MSARLTPWSANCTRKEPRRSGAATRVDGPIPIATVCQTHIGRASGTLLLGTLKFHYAMLPCHQQGSSTLAEWIVCQNHNLKERDANLPFSLALVKHPLNGRFLSPHVHNDLRKTPNDLRAKIMVEATVGVGALLLWGVLFRSDSCSFIL